MCMFVFKGRREINRARSCFEERVAEGEENRAVKDTKRMEASHVVAGYLGISEYILYF